MTRNGFSLIIDRFAWGISIILHPVFLPFYAVLVYFSISEYFYYDLYKLLRLIFIPAVLVPLLMQYLLWRLKILRSFFLENPGARKYFSAFMGGVYLFLYQFLSPISVLHELSLFFLGTAIALWVSVALNFFRLKISLHAMAFGGIFVFFLIWSARHRQNILDLLAILILLAAVTMAARLRLKAHSPAEIFIGLLTGILSVALVFYVK